MDPGVQAALVGALTAGIITSIGWFVSYYLARRREAESRQKETKQRYLERQIEELYSPLWGLIQQSEIVHDVAKRKLPTGSTGGIERALFDEADAQVWSYLMDRYFLPTNKQMAELIRRKVYLIASEDVPPSFIGFLKHQAQLDVLHRLWIEKGIASWDIPGAAWPKSFNDVVKQSLDDLREQHRHIAATE